MVKVVSCGIRCVMWYEVCNVMEGGQCGMRYVTWYEVFNVVRCM